MADHIFSEVKKADRIFADETTLPPWLPAPDRRRRPTYGAYADRTFGSSGPPMVAYRFENTGDEPLTLVGA
nr:hypothetical protein [Bradyrhizobium iriomotense]